MERAVKINGVYIKEGDYLTIDGLNGTIAKGKVELLDSLRQDYFSRFMSWISPVQAFPVRANADSAGEVIKSITNGADGLGTCRTEHMFLNTKRLDLLQRILTGSYANNDIEILKECQKNDFLDILRVLQGTRFTVRLLDAPLHEFLQSSSQVDKNPMIGCRGIRLAITNPLIYEIQANAVFSAVVEYQIESGQKVVPYLMVPMVCDPKEVECVKIVIKKEARKFDIEYKIGALIETPRAAIFADKIAEHVDFLSIGSNDLTQMTYGISRDDYWRFMPAYRENFG